MTETRSGKTYAEITAEIERLRKQAEEIKETERAEAMAQIKDLVARYEIGEKQLLSALPGKAAKTKVAPKYRDPATGQTWTGRGRAPRWMAESGKPRESFLIA